MAVIPVRRDCRAGLPHWHCQPWCRWRPSLLVTIELLAGPIAGTLAGSSEVAGPAAAWLRVAALGIPGLLVATAGNGWLRGVQDTRRPMRYLLGANLLSAVLVPLLVFPGSVAGRRGAGGARRGRRARAGPSDRAYRAASCR